MSNFSKFQSITFEDEPSTNTPLSSANINFLEENINNSLAGVFGSSGTISVNNADIVYKDGIYLIARNTTNFPFNTTNAQGILIVLSKPTDESSSWQRVTQIAIDNNERKLWIRNGEYFPEDEDTTFDVSWKSLESITKIPTDSSIEKTDMIIGSKPVYVKRLTVASLPNASTLSVPIGITDNITPYKFEGMSTRSTDNVYLPIPYTASGNSQIGLNYAGNNKTLSLTTFADRSNMSGYIDFYFTYDN